MSPGVLAGDMGVSVWVYESMLVDGVKEGKTYLPNSTVEET